MNGQNELMTVAPEVTSLKFYIFRKVYNITESRSDYCPQLQPILGNTSRVQQALQVAIREHSTLGGSMTVQLVSSLTRQQLTKKNICYCLCVVKNLNPNSWNWRQAVYLLIPTVSVLWLLYLSRLITRIMPIICSLNQAINCYHFLTLNLLL